MLFAKAWRRRSRCSASEFGRKVGLQENAHRHRLQGYLRGLTGAASFLPHAAASREFPARMHKSKNLRELSARWACKRIAIVPWHPFSGISLQFRGVAL